MHDDHTLAHSGASHSLERERDALARVRRGYRRPLALHALNDRGLVVAIGVGAQQDGIAGLDAAPVDDPIHDGAHIGHRPHLGHRVLERLVRRKLLGIALAGR